MGAWTVTERCHGLPTAETGQLVQETALESGRLGLGLPLSAPLPALGWQASHLVHLAVSVSSPI